MFVKIVTLERGREAGANTRLGYSTYDHRKGGYWRYGLYVRLGNTIYTENREQKVALVNMREGDYESDIVPKSDARRFTV